MNKNIEDKDFLEILKGRHIPILTLDPKWELLFADEGIPEDIRQKADELNHLLSVQSILRGQMKERKRQKSQWLEEMVDLREQARQTEENVLIEQELQRHREQINECNQKLEELTEAQIGLPTQIYELNFSLMLMTMDLCYRDMQENTDKIRLSNEWIRQVRIELKKQLIRKQESEFHNYQIYQYMHDIFGPEVIDVFDLEYDPEKWHPVLDDKPASGG